jgi:hypothetical protein
MNSKKINKIVKTSGDGLWGESNKPKEVKISKIEWETNNLGEDDTETSVRIYFTKKSWDTNKDGLIYTDRGFIKEVKELFVSMQKEGKLPMKLPFADIGYSEQGMQGYNYIHTVLGSW